MADRPNILIFMTDHEQSQVLDPAHPCITPNATAFAQQGLTFDRTFTCTAHCCPARATFMSGLYPSRHGVYNNVSTTTAIHHGLNPGVRLFSEDLAAAGYDLAYAGKWHVTAEENPSDRGWRDLHVSSRGKVENPKALFDMYKKLGRPDLSVKREKGQMLRPGWGPRQVYQTHPDGSPLPYSGHSDYKAVKSAVEELPKLAESGKPWGLFIGPNAPHDPYHAYQHYVDMYDPDKVELPASFYDTLLDKPRIYQRMRKQYWDQLTEREVREAIAHYWAMCTMLDDMFGEVLAALDKTGQADNTLVLYTSDHGDYIGAHGIFSKGVPAFREAYHIPALVRWPKGIKNPGRRVNSLTSIADFAPTFLEAAGCEVPKGLTGQSLMPFIRDEKPEAWRDELHTQFNGVEQYYTQRSVRTDGYKYVYNGFDFDELYNLKEDPHETFNRAEHPAYQEIKREMVDRMWRFAYKEKDYLMFNHYVTVALAPYGPADVMSDIHP